MKKTFILFTTAFLLTACQSMGLANTDDAMTRNKVELMDINDKRLDWAKANILAAVDKGYVDGYEDGTFRPDNELSRAEFLKMLLTATQVSASATTNGVEWFTPYVDSATKEGILRDNDFPDGALNGSISRLEMARIALRSVDKRLQDKDIHMDDTSVMYNATKNGIIQGLAQGALSPGTSTTRAQSVTIIERVLKFKQGLKLDVDKYAVNNAELALKHTNLFSMIPAFSGEFNKGYEWSVDKLTYETPDGLYKSTIDAVVAIDLTDPNDPNRYLLGDINALRWDNGANKIEQIPWVSDSLNSYAIVLKRHVDFNKDTIAYSTNGALGMLIQGFDRPDDVAFRSGVLNTYTQIFKDRPGDMAAYILPKEVPATPNGITISVRVPARPPVEDRTHVITDLRNPR